MFVLVQDPDSELGGGAASSYGESLLRAKGISKAPEAAQSIRAVAAEVSAQSADPLAVRRRGTSQGQRDWTTRLVCTGSITHTALRVPARGARRRDEGDEAGP